MLGQLPPTLGSLNVQSAVLFLIIFLIVFHWVRLPRNLPPGPRGWPILGNLFALRSAGHSFKVFTEWSRVVYVSGVISVRIGRKLIVVLNEWSCIKEAMIEQADVFSDRAVSNVVRIMWGPGLQGSFIFENGAVSKERRRFGIRALKNFGMGKRSIEMSINEEARYLLGCLLDRTGKPFDPTHLVNNAVSNIICTISFGYRFDYSDAKFTGLITMLRENMRATGTSLLANAFAWLAYTPLYYRVKQRYDNLKRFIHGIVQDHRYSYDHNHIRDVIDMYLTEVEQRKGSGTEVVGDTFEHVFSNKSLSRGILDLFIAGTDTTSNTLLWFLMYMAFNQNIQRKVQSEIDDVVGESRQPSMADSPKMPYTNAAVLETLRIRPVAPLAVPHQSRVETTLDGYTIPKENCILINVWALHHNPATWPEPERYDPCRFLSDDGKSIVHHETFIPFGIGNRTCMGKSLAKTNLFLFAVNLLQQFTFKFPDGKPTPSQDGVFGIILSPGPYEICVNIRHH